MQDERFPTVSWEAVHLLTPRLSQIGHIRGNAARRKPRSTMSLTGNVERADRHGVQG